MARLVVGLGNPGKTYEKSKHNIGFICLDYYAKQKKFKFKKEPKFQGEVLVVGQNVLLKPKTFMNLSGNSVKSVADYYKINIEDILVISDDIDLPFPKLRLREKGSAGGHNGLKSIISCLGASEFKRCRIGIGRDDSKEVRDHVLSDFSKAEMKELSDTCIVVEQMIDFFFANESFQISMNKINVDEKNR